MNCVVASIIMPTFNTPYKYLEEAVKSIVNQTYEDYEFIIVDDASTEYNDRQVLDKIFSLSDKIHVIKNTHRKGVAGALNTGIEKAKGKYIVRMDSDDVAEPGRLEAQIDCLEKHPEISLVAGYVKCFGASRKWIKSAIGNTAIKTGLFFESGIVHPTVCIRRNHLEKYGLSYNEHMQNEDYDLWFRCGLHKDFKFFTYPQKVLNYRVHAGQVTKQRIEKLMIQGQDLRKRIIKALNIKLEPRAEEIFVDFTLGLPFSCKPLELANILFDVEKQAFKIEIFENKKEFKSAFQKKVLKKYIKLLLKGKVFHCLGMISFIVKQGSI